MGLNKKKRTEESLQSESEKTVSPQKKRHYFGKGSGKEAVDSLTEKEKTATEASTVTGGKAKKRFGKAAKKEGADLLVEKKHKVHFAKGLAKKTKGFSGKGDGTDPAGSGQKIKRKGKTLWKHKQDSNTEPQRVDKVFVFQEIQFKLYSLIVVPIVFLLVLGVVSYNKASSGIRSTYVSSITGAVDVTSSYYEFVFDSLKSDFNELFTESKLRTYVNGGYTTMQSTEGMSYYNEKYKEFNYNVTDNKFVDDVYVLTDNEKSITTTNTTTKKLYSMFCETEQGKMALDNPTSYLFCGSMPEIDEKMKADTEEYALRVIRKVPQGEGLFVMDLDRAEMEEILGQLDIGEGSIVAFVTQDGQEVYAKDDAEDSEKKTDAEEKETKAYFVGQGYFEKVMESEDMSSQQDVTFDGVQYMFHMEKIGKTGTAVCCLIPKSTINAQASDIKSATILLLLISIVVSAILGLVIAQGMTKTIHSILGQIKKVSSGDLTVRIQVRRKDEFAVLATGLSDMIVHTKHLIQKVEGVSSELTSISDKVICNSEEFLESSKGIENSVGEIEQGTNSQAQHSLQCLEQMDTLSNRITVVNKNTQKISNIAGDTEKSIQTGMSSMEVLNEKSHSTAEITHVVIDSIQNLEKQSKSIGQIVNAINDIASETNLLSLNASIEAARAGEAGRGFAVVATQIRKLADQSMESAEQIQKIIEEIVTNTNNAVGIAMEADGIVQEQQEAVDETTEAFRTMEKQIGVLMKELEGILEGVHEMDRTRSVTLSAIEEISAAAEQTAASATSVKESVSRQLAGVEELNENSEQLSASSEELQQAINQFTIR